MFLYHSLAVNITNEQHLLELLKNWNFTRYKFKNDSNLRTRNVEKNITIVQFPNINTDRKVFARNLVMEAFDKRHLLKEPWKPAKNISGKDPIYENLRSKNIKRIDFEYIRYLRDVMEMEEEFLDNNQIKMGFYSYLYFGPSDDTPNTPLIFIHNLMERETVTFTVDWNMYDAKRKDSKICSLKTRLSSVIRKY